MTKAKGSGSTRAFDSFRVSKPASAAQVNAKQLAAATRKAATVQDLVVEAKGERKDGDLEEVDAKQLGVPVREATPEASVRPELDPRDEIYLEAMEEILAAKRTPLLHTKPDAIDVILRDFDLKGAYGPCVGITRQQRYDRASRLGLRPPKEVGLILATRQAHEKDALKHDLFFGRL